MLHKNVQCEDCPSRPESIFRDLNPQEISDLNRCKTTNRYKKNQVIFYEDNKPFGIHCIREGRIKLFRTGTDGREQIIQIAGPGDIIGFKSLIADFNYSVSAEALEDTEVCFVDRKVFFELIDHSPKLSRHLLETACHEIQANEDTICRVTQRSVRERVAETLLVLKERFGVVEGSSWVLDIPLKREEIAAIAGTVLESAVRHLSEFKDEGVIETRGKIIVIKNLEALIRIAGI